MRQVIVRSLHRGLEALYERNLIREVQAAHAPKLRRILSALDVAQRIFEIPTAAYCPMGQNELTARP